MGFREFDRGTPLPAIEDEVLDRWEREGTFERSVSERADAPPFVFFEGPPTANGHPGAHHALARTIKDIVCRYKTMRGFRVDRKAGWDTHGLPVEIEVEKELKLESKEDIERYGVEAFIEKCRASVFTYKDEWDALTRRMGYWIDLDSAYITCTNEYIESVWHILATLWEKGLIYKGHKILPYCPRCGTPLSSHEVAQGYADAEDPSVFVRMRVKGEENVSFLVWTTTPWTLISNVALAVAPEETYVRARVGGETLILAEALLPALEAEYEVVERVKGADLLGTEYEPLFSFVPLDRPGHRVVAADFVTLEDGTGIVHIAPAFGEDDANLGRTEDLPFVQPVDGAGRFTDEVTPWAGTFIKEADPLILEDLKGRGLLYRAGTVVHTYPFCWRCDSPLVYYARESWYVRTTEFRDEMMRNNAEIDWHPKEIGANRLGDWLENNIDWAVSRDRYWGTPLNIWTCDSCGHQHAVGSVAELERLAVEGLEGELDLHKPYVDRVVLACPECGGRMSRTPEVIDCWFDTGSMPYAQWHYPFENVELFDSHFPSDFIAEGVDQTRGWFYSLLAISTMISGTSSFRRCVVNDMVLDAEGKKMSKSVGNVADSFEIMATIGADALRWYFMASSPPWLPKKFDAAGVREAASKVMDTLRNTYGFFALYANIDGFDPEGHAVDAAERPVVDRWMLSRLHSTVRDVGEAMESYDITKAVRKLQSFIQEDISNWYVRVSRPRFWKGEMDVDKRSAFSTLHEVLVATCRAMAPFAPFLPEAVHGRLTEGESVHLMPYPVHDEKLVDASLERAMESARRVVALGRAARNAASIKVRQPLSRLLVAGVPEKERRAVSALEALVLSELNVKALEWAEADDLASLSAAPVFPALGPKHGKGVNAVAEAIRAMGPDDASRLASGSSVEVEVDGRAIVVEPSDVTIETGAKAGLAVETDAELTVGLDTEMTDELRDEGFAREFTNKIQFMRKDAGFEVTDRIRVWYEASPRLRAALTTYADRIAHETLAESFEEGKEAGELEREWDVNGEAARIAVARV
jgi:isoleucyl-tRNA synthetase